ncbi:MAG: hypothetical protein KAU28_02925 [Phycisphaerae bacterium]|nr:hypothetical protein [Phycisphaerae bacterium]
MLENDRRLYAGGVAMQTAAREFSDHMGYQVSGHFLGRVVARLGRERRLRYRGTASVILNGRVCPIEYSMTVWARLGGACRWLVAQEGADLDNEYIARRIIDGVVTSDGTSRFLPVADVSIRAVELARRAAGV